MSNKSKSIDASVTTKEPSERIALKMRMLIAHILSAVEQNESEEKLHEVVQYFMYYFYFDLVERNGLFAQDGILEMMRQVEINVLGFTSVQGSNIDQFINNDNFFDQSNCFNFEVITEVYS